MLTLDYLSVLRNALSALQSYANAVGEFLLWIGSKVWNL